MIDSLLEFAWTNYFKFWITCNISFFFFSRCLKKKQRVVYCWFNHSAADPCCCLLLCNFCKITVAHRDFGISTIIPYIYLMCNGFPVRKRCREEHEEHLRQWKKMPYCHVTNFYINPLQKMSYVCNSLILVTRKNAWKELKHLILGI